MAADRYSLEKNYLLINEENCNLDDALLEYSSVRHDLFALLQPRPKPSFAAASTKGVNGQRERTPPPTIKESQGKGHKKGDKKGTSKGESNNHWMNNWDKSWFTQETNMVRLTTDHAPRNTRSHGHRAQKADAYRAGCGLEPIRRNQASQSLRGALLFAGWCVVCNRVLQRSFPLESSLDSSARRNPTAFSTLRTSPQKTLNVM